MFIRIKEYKFSQLEGWELKKDSISFNVANVKTPVTFKCMPKVGIMTSMRIRECLEKRNSYFDVYGFIKTRNEIEKNFQDSFKEDSPEA